ncbi:hypothetical protein [Tahibacter caeni]|uniref:hypothetical protein n=1 Tax=Tahibacter caeni TaxID=1453545 RepID=UPI002147D179|nr:hypothetical protein [Tahibacter caeni]
MSDYRVRLHLLRLPQLDKDAACGFALGIDADFDPAAFAAVDGVGPQQIAAVRAAVRDRLPEDDAAGYEAALAVPLGLLMPWTWTIASLDLRGDGNSARATLLPGPLAEADCRKAIYQFVDRRREAGGAWADTLYDPAAAARYWSTPPAEVVLQPQSFPPWAAVLATLGQETAPVPVRYAGVYRLFTVRAAELAALGNAVRARLRVGAQDNDLEFDFSTDESIVVNITVDGRPAEIAARLAACDPRPAHGWMQSGGWITQTVASQGPGLDVLPQRLLPWFDRPAVLLHDEGAVDLDLVTRAIDERPGFGARHAAGEVQLALDGANLIRAVVQDPAAVAALEARAQAWVSEPNVAARLDALLGDARARLPATWNEHADGSAFEDAWQRLDTAARRARLRELALAVATPEALLRRYQRLWKDVVAGLPWPSIAETDLARRVELDDGSAGVAAVLAANGALASRGALGAAIAAALQASLAIGPVAAAAWKDLAIEAVWPEAQPASPSADPSDADGIALQIQSGQNDAALADLSGVGLLIRRETPAPSGWRCPSLGEGLCERSGFTWPHALSALPFQRMQGMLRTGVVYRGDTLVQFDDALAARAEAPGGPAIESMYAVRMPEEPHPDMQVPALAYGADYRLAAFALPNPGVLPAVLQAPGDPLRLRDGLRQQDLAGIPAQDLAFRRRAGVQALEFIDAARRTALREPASAGAAYSRDTPLLAHELERPQALQDAHLLAPLLLLPQRHPEARFVVRPPRIDCLGFVRWCEYDRLSNPADHRWDRFLLAAEALAWYLEEADDAERRRCLPTDPAVAALRFSLLDENGDAVGEAKERRLRAVLPQDVPDDYGHGDLSRDDRGHVGIALTFGGDAASIALDGDILAIRVPEASVHYLRMQPVSDARDLARFAAGTRGTWPGVVLPVECATRTIGIDAQQLYRSLALTLADPQASRDVELSLVVADADRRAFRRIWKIETGTQAWRWQGRPFQPPPRTAPAPAVDSAGAADLDWEADAFADRAPEAAHVSSCRVLAGASVLLRREPGGGDTRERYFRFSVAAHHRYADIYRALGEPLPAHEARLSARRRREAPYPFNDPWLPALRPGRNTEPVPPPLVKAFVPLTLAAESRSASGVMCLLNEGFCDIGGTAEGIEAVIDDVWLKTSDGAETGLQQFGADPLFSGAERSGAEEPLRTLDVRGPLGHTFDTDTVAPLFVATSFLLDPPDDALPFHFMKLKLRRVLDPAGMGDPKAPPTAADAATVAARGEFVAVIDPEDVDGVATLSLGTSEPAALRLHVDEAGWRFDVQGAFRRVLKGAGKGRLSLYVKRLRDVRELGRVVGSDWEVAACVAETRNGRPLRRRVFSASLSHRHASQPLGFGISLAGCSGARIASGPRLSDYTPPTWTQCLPDRRWLLPPGFDALTLRVADAGFTLRDARGDTVALQSVPLANEGGADGMPRGVAQLLLVTRRSRGIDGREFDAYVGLYAHAAASGAFETIDGADVRAVDAGLRVRLVWVQVVPACFDRPFARNGFWNLCFPAADDDGRPVDAQARIVGLSESCEVKAAEQGG